MGVIVAGCTPAPSPPQALPPPAEAAPTASASAMASEPAPAGGRASLWLEGSSACAIAAGEVWCWGQDEQHVFAGGSDIVPAPVRLEALRGATAIDFGGFGPGGPRVGYALMADGAVKVLRKGAVTPLPHVERAMDLAGTYFAACVVTPDGGVKCVEPEPERPPLAAPALGKATAIAACDASAFCAAHDGGKVACWEYRPGSNALVLEDHGVIAEISGARSLAVTTYLACALGDGVRCWSFMGDRKLAAFEVAFPEEVTSIAVGGEDVCAVLASGAVACAIAGPSSGTVRQEAKVLAGVSGATELAVGDGVACARAGGAIWCWGSDELGQLGDGDGAAASPGTPVRAAIP
jgi:hypothetical protein